MCLIMSQIKQRHLNKTKQQYNFYIYTSTIVALHCKYTVRSLIRSNTTNVLIYGSKVSGPTWYFSCDLTLVLTAFNLCSVSPVGHRFPVWKGFYSAKKCALFFRSDRGCQGLLWCSRETRRTCERQPGIQGTGWVEEWAGGLDGGGLMKCYDKEYR